MKSPSILAIVIACAGCATTSNELGAASATDFDALEPFYGVTEAPATPDEAVAMVMVGACRYGLALADFHETAEVDAVRREISTRTDGAEITVQFTRPDADFDATAAAAYRRTVNEVPAPFYGYATGPVERHAASETFGFAVRDDSRRDEPGTHGVVHLSQDPATGSVITFTAVWPFDAADETIERRMLELAASQSFACG